MFQNSCRILIIFLSTQTNTMSDEQYELQKDKLGRARCTVCCDKIEVGELRVGYGRGKHAHLKCWKVIIEHSNIST